jgi:hypothetical protein
MLASEPRSQADVGAAFGHGGCGLRGLGFGRCRGLLRFRDSRLLSLGYRLTGRLLSLGDGYRLGRLGAALFLEGFERG